MGGWDYGVCLRVFKARVQAPEACAALCRCRVRARPDSGTTFFEEPMNQSSATSSVSPLAPVAAHRGARVAIISASWHQDIVHQARDAALAEFDRHGLPPAQVALFDVPGAFEIPLLARKLARSGRYDAIVACALVVNGGIYRHEFVTTAVIDGLMRVQLDTEVPVMSAVLTPRDFHDHEDHVRFFREHFVKKGTEVAQACLQTMAYLRKLASPTLANAQHGAPLAEAA